MSLFGTHPDFHVERSTEELPPRPSTPYFGGLECKQGDLFSFDGLVYNKRTKKRYVAPSQSWGASIQQRSCECRFGSPCVFHANVSKSDDSGLLFLGDRVECTTVPFYSLRPTPTATALIKARRLREEYEERKQWLIESNARAHGN